MSMDEEDNIDITFSFSRNVISRLDETPENRRLFADLIQDIIDRIIDKYIKKPDYKNIKHAVFHSTSQIQNQSCPICLEDIQPFSFIGISSCLHGFHKPCIEEARHFSHTKCPICRQDLD